MTHHLHTLVAAIYAAIGQAYIGLANLADDNEAVREIGRLHLQDAARQLRECGDSLEKLSESESEEE